MTTSLKRPAQRKISSYVEYEEMAPTLAVTAEMAELALAAFIRLEALHCAALVPVQVTQ